MRAIIAALALLLSLALAGCGGATDDGSGTTTTSTSPTTTTTTTPNMAPTLVVKVTTGGAQGNVTLVGQNVTFDASGSTDDGQLSVIAVAAQDANGTHAPQLLYFDGTFRTANFTFDVPGPVNVTVTAVDNRNADTTHHLMLYVNEAVTGSNAAAMRLVVPTQAGAPTTCKGPTGQAPADAEFSFQAPFAVRAGAQAVTAKVTAGGATIAICDPAGVAISPAGTDVKSNAGTTFTPPTGTATYFVQAFSTQPNQAVGAVTIDVVVHYEPQA